MHRSLGFVFSMVALAAAGTGGVVPFAEPPALAPVVCEQAPVVTPVETVELPAPKPAQAISYVSEGDEKQINGKPHRLTRIGDGYRWLPIQSSRPVSSPGRSWTINGQAWTQQTLTSHLSSHPNHSRSMSQLQGMSLGQLDALHTADHERTRSTPVMRSAPTRSSCPGGVCPTRTRQRFGLFR